MSINDNNRRINHRKTDIATAAINLAASKKSVTELLLLLNHSNAAIRISAIDALCYKRGLEAIQGIINRLNDSDYHVRIAACNALAKMRAHTAKRQLYDALCDTNPLVCCAAASALSIMGDKIGLPHVVKHLRTSGPYQLEALKSLNLITGCKFPLNRKGLEQALRWLDSLRKR